MVLSAPNVRNLRKRGKKAKTSMSAQYVVPDIRYRRNDFQDTRKPLRTWFTAIWWVTTQKNGASAAGLQQVLGLGSYQTAWTWLHKIRTAMVNPNRTKLSGVVEVDETYIGGEDEGGKRGRGADHKILVVIGIELLEGKNQ